MLLSPQTHVGHIGIHVLDHPSFLLSLCHAQVWALHLFKRPSLLLWLTPVRIKVRSLLDLSLIAQIDHLISPPLLRRVELRPVHLFHLLYGGLSTGTDVARRPLGPVDWRQQESRNGSDAVNVFFLESFLRLSSLLRPGPSSKHLTELARH